MSEPRNVRVMISSRSMSHVTFEKEEEALTLESLRRDLKSRIESVELFGKQIFEVWIHEDATAEDASLDAWDESLQQIRQADIVLVLFNGEAGWTVPKGTQGICHDEMAAAIDKAPGKVRVVELPLAALPRGAAARRRDQRFRDYVERQARWRVLAASRAKSWDAAQRSLRAAFNQLVTLGSREAGVGSLAYGTALDWDLLSFDRRREAMIAELREALSARAGKPQGDQAVVVPEMGDHLVYFQCDAVPAAMGIAAAREMVGQPFLQVRELDAEIKKTQATAGPIHLIACHKGVTETQAVKMLGYPNATIISAPFGVYVADDVHKVQLVLIANCRNASAVHHGVQRFFTWLEQAEEQSRLVGRAESRRIIIDAIAGQQPDNL